MYYLRIYELWATEEDCVTLPGEYDFTSHALAYEEVKPYVGPGFLNAVNRYYQTQLWR